MRLTRGARAITACAAVVSVAAACTASGGGTAGPPGASAITRSVATGVATLHPSIPGVFRTGDQNCGNPYGISATTVHGTIPLLDCPGLAGLRPAPVVHLRLGDDVLLSGIPSTASLSVRPPNLTRTTGSTLVAVDPGTTTVTIHDFDCVPLGRGQPRTCRLLLISARR